MSTTVKAEGTGSVAVAGNVVGATIITGEPKKRTFEQVQREFHEAVSRADGAASLMRDTLLEGKQYPKEFITPFNAYQRVAELALELSRVLPQ